MKNKNIIYKKSFEPLYKSNAKILILGTLPSDKSLEKNIYYENRNNKFWEILYAIFNNNKVLNDYTEKKEFLYKNNIALWDIYKKAQREGNLDKNIKTRNQEFNDIKSLLNKLPNIKNILLNGRKAERGFKKYIKKYKLKAYLEKNNINYQYVFSSSGLNTKSKDEKVENWKNAININKN